MSAQNTMSKVRIQEVKRFMVECFKTVGVTSKIANEHADLLLHADKVGHFSHGINRLELYINDIQSGNCNPHATPEILKENYATAWVDGHSALGSTVGHFCMDLAMTKARQSGVGWVCAKGTNHYGMAGWWALKAEKEGFLGMSFTNTSPLMAPTRSKKGALGTNPISLYAPGKDGDHFLLDMATTGVAVGKIEMEMRKKNPLPEGWAQGPDGNSTTDAELAFKTGCLMPLGGGEQTAGYKGFGLGALVEIFCGISAGSRYGHTIRSWSHSGEGGPANLGQCFIAVDPCSFAPGFQDRMQDCLDYWRSLEPANPQLPVIAPGEKEKTNEAEADSAGTISYIPDQIRTLDALAERLKIAPVARC